MTTCAPSKPPCVLSEDETEPGPAVADGRPTRSPRRFVFVERPTQDVIDELCRIDLR